MGKQKFEKQKSGRIMLQCELIVECLCYKCSIDCYDVYSSDGEVGFLVLRVRRSLKVFQLDVSCSPSDSRVRSRIQVQTSLEVLANAKTEEMGGFMEIVGLLAGSIDFVA